MKPKRELYLNVRAAYDPKKKDVDSVIEMLEEMTPDKIPAELVADFDTFFFLSKLQSSLIFLRTLKQAAEEMDEKFGPNHTDTSKLDA